MKDYSKIQFYENKPVLTFEKVSYKKLADRLYQYENSNHFELSDIYENWSIYKERAFNYYRHIPYLRILSFNINFFTLGFVLQVEDGVFCLYVITPTKKQYCILPKGVY